MARGVMFVIRSTEDKLLLQFRDGQCSHSPLKWTFFGGVLDEGESYRDAAHRELSEELDIVATAVELPVIFTIERDDGDIVVYELKPRTSWSAINLREGAGMAFLSGAEVRTLGSLNSLSRCIVQAIL